MIPLRHIIQWCSYYRSLVHVVRWFLWLLFISARHICSLTDRSDHCVWFIGGARYSMCRWPCVCLCVQSSIFICMHIMLAGWLVGWFVWLMPTSFYANNVNEIMWERHIEMAKVRKMYTATTTATSLAYKSYLIIIYWQNNYVYFASSLAREKKKADQKKMEIP